MVCKRSSFGFFSKNGRDGRTDLHSQSNLRTSLPCTTSLVVAGSKAYRNDQLWKTSVESHLVKHIHTLPAESPVHACFPRGVFSCVNFASLDRFTQPKNNSGSFIFVLSQLFWGEQCATVLPIHNRTKREAILLLDWFSRFLYDFGRKY